MESIEEYATGPDAPRDWQRLAKRVEAGEFTWADVQEGRLVDDPDFLDALGATVRDRAPEEKEPADADLEEADPFADPEPDGTHTGWPKRQRGIDDEDLPDVFFGPSD